MPDERDLDAWERIAFEYHRHILRGDVLREQILDPAILAAMGELGNRRILDLGCGQGYLAHRLTEAGGVVTAIDGSAALIALAKQTYPENERLSFIAGDIRHPLPFSGGTFDLIVSNLAFMDIDPLESTMQECARVLRPNGTLIISLIHPAFMSGGRLTRTFRAIFGAPLAYAINAYHTPLRRLWRIRGLSGKTPYYHRPLEYYAELLKNSLFAITDLREPVLPRGERYPNAFLKLCTEIPPFVIIRAERRRISLPYASVRTR